jgi:predicted MFS family arabinose efflux permease
VTFWLSLAVIMICGWGMVSYLAVANSFIQITVPDELRGRVMSVYSLVFLGTVPIGNAIMGVIAERLGTPRAVTVSGVVCLLAAAVFARTYLKQQDTI